MGFSLIYTPVLHYDDINGRPLVGGKLYTYKAGTSTPATTYRNKNGTELNENPITLNERGECVCFLEEGMDYKFVLKDKLDAVIWEQDDVSVPEGNGGGVAQVQSNWNESNTSSPAFIRNKPLVTSVTTTIEGPGDDITENVRSLDIDLNTGRVTCDQSYVAGFIAKNVAEPPEETKLLSIGAGESSPSWKGMGSVQVQANWSEEDPNSPAYINGKPTLFNCYIVHNGVDRSAYSLTIDDNKVTSRYRVGNTIYNKVMGYLSPSLEQDLKVLESETMTIDTATARSLYVEDGKAYDIVLDDVSAEVHLNTNSETTLHTVLKVHSASSSYCSEFNLVWYDEALVEHTVSIDMTGTDKEFYFDVYIRKVEYNGVDYVVARVSDFPCGYRQSPGSSSTRDNNTNWIGRNVR